MITPNGAGGRREGPFSSPLPSLQLSFTQHNPTEHRRHSQVTQNQKDSAAARGNLLPKKSLFYGVKRVLLIYLTEMRAG